MAMSNVRKATLAFINGAATVDQVIAALRPKPAPPVKSPEQILLETSEDFQDDDSQDNTWADVDRYWDLMTPEQQEELTKARVKRFGE